MPESALSCSILPQGTTTTSAGDIPGTVKLWEPPRHSRGVSRSSCRSSEREPADSLRGESNIIGGWLPSLTFALSIASMLYDFIKWFTRKLVSPLLLFGWLALTSPPILWLIWLRHSHEEYARIVSWLGFPLALVWLAGGVWLAMTTARYMFDDNRLFFTAVRYTLSDLRLKLAFVPIIGGLFMSDEDKTHNDDDGA